MQPNETVLGEQLADLAAQGYDTYDTAVGRHNRIFNTTNERVNMSSQDSAREGYNTMLLYSRLPDMSDDNWARILPFLGTDEDPLPAHPTTIRTSYLPTLTTNHVIGGGATGVSAYEVLQEYTRALAYYRLYSQNIANFSQVLLPTIGQERPARDVQEYILAMDAPMLTLMGNGTPLDLELARVIQSYYNYMRLIAELMQPFWSNYMPRDQVAGALLAREQPTRVWEQLFPRLRVIFTTANQMLDAVARHQAELIARTTSRALALTRRIFPLTQRMHNAVDGTFTDLDDILHGPDFERLASELHSDAINDILALDYMANNFASDLREAVSDARRAAGLPADADERPAFAPPVARRRQREATPGIEPVSQYRAPLPSPASAAAASQSVVRVSQTPATIDMRTASQRIPSEVVQFPDAFREVSEEEREDRALRALTSTAAQLTDRPALLDLGVKGSQDDLQGRPPPRRVGRPPTGDSRNRKIQATFGQIAASNRMALPQPGKKITPLPRERDDQPLSGAQPHLAFVRRTAPNTAFVPPAPAQQGKTPVIPISQPSQSPSAQTPRRSPSRRGAATTARAIDAAQSQHFTSQPIAHQAPELTPSPSASQQRPVGNIPLQLLNIPPPTESQEGDIIVAPARTRARAPRSISPGKTQVVQRSAPMQDWERQFLEDYSAVADAPPEIGLVIAAETQIPRTRNINPQQMPILRGEQHIQSTEPPSDDEHTRAGPN